MVDRTGTIFRSMSHNLFYCEEHNIISGIQLPNLTISALCTCQMKGGTTTKQLSYDWPTEDGADVSLDQ